MKNVNQMNLTEKIEFLREEPIFWSRFGIEYDGWDKHHINVMRHKALADKGIVVHSSVIPIGWIGPNQYDYTEVDKLFDLLFTTCPDIVFLPHLARILGCTTDDFFEMHGGDANESN